MVGRISSREIFELASRAQYYCHELFLYGIGAVASFISQYMSDFGTPCLMCSLVSLSIASAAGMEQNFVTVAIYLGMYRRCVDRPSRVHRSIFIQDGCIYL